VGVSLSAPVDDDGFPGTLLNDRDDEDVVRAAGCPPAQQAVKYLETVSGHGVESLLNAAKNLVEDGSYDPSDAISSWYKNYHKSDNAARVLTVVGHKNKKYKRTAVKIKENTQAKPKAGQPAKRLNQKRVKAAMYRRNVSE